MTSDTTTRLLWAADFFKKYPKTTQTELLTEVKKHFGIGVRTQSARSIVNGDGVPTPKREITQRHANIDKPMPRKVDGDLGMLERAVKLGAKKVTLPDGTMVEF